MILSKQISEETSMAGKTGTMKRLMLFAQKSYRENLIYNAL